MAAIALNEMRFIILRNKNIDGVYDEMECLRDYERVDWLPRSKKGIWFFYLVYKM